MQGIAGGPHFDATLDESNVGNQEIIHVREFSGTAPHKVASWIMTLQYHTHTLQDCKPQGFMMSTNPCSALEQQLMCIDL